jgi:hypothetical protein
LDVWCIDATHILLGSDNYTIVSPTTNNGNGTAGTYTSLSPTVLTEIGELVQFGDANIGKYYGVSAAVQLAIWTVEYPGATFTSADGFINHWVSALVLEAQTGALPAFNGVLSEVVDPTHGNQGLVYEVPDITTIGGSNLLPTPLPSTWTMMLIGLAGLGLLAFCRQKRPAALSIA